MRDDRMRLQRTMLHRLGAKGIVENFVGFSKAEINIAFGIDRLMRDVGSGNRCQSRASALLSR